MKINLIIVGALLLSSLVLAQKPPVKFGKMDDELVKMTSHPLDPDADAIVLTDFGDTQFRYDNEKGFIFEFERLVRIKVFTKDGLEYGDFRIPYYESGAQKERVSSIKGFIYNVEKGAVTKSKLGKSSIYDEEETERWRAIKISMPDVKEGSVIELSYKLISPFIWNLTTWKFQDDIPTVHSEYKVTIPEYFDYQLLFSGYHPMAVNERDNTSGFVIIQTKNRTGYTNVKTTYDTDKYDYRATKYRWVAKDVPAFKLESYVASPNDYLSKIRFELKGTRFPQSPYKPYMGTWATLNKSFLEHSKFGIAIKTTGFIRDELDVIGSMSDDIGKIEALVKLVQNHMEWNDRYRRYVDNTLRKAWIDQKGSSADINMIIVAGLRKLGFDANPVLISTRGHGMIRENYAISSQFNSVVASVRLGDKEILLDGTDKYLPVGVLPKSTLNGKGWKVSKTSPGWVKLNPSTKQEQIFNTNLIIESNGGVSGTLDFTAKGYAGYSSHKALKIKGEEKFFEDFQENNNDWLIEDYEFNHDKGSSEPFQAKYSIEWNENLTASADLIYFNSTFGEIMDENPFKLEKREYPVDYGFPIRREYNFRFQLPEGYGVEEVPESASIAMKNNVATFDYNISKDNPGELVVKAIFSINKTRFVQTEYSELKKFYNSMVKKCAEQVVLKKSSGQ
ncbi:MAG: DUF3857 domain-containing protein [Bacteroidota bacterium]